jgi:hypothetical protein
MKRTTLSTVLYVLLVFLSGGVVGAFATRLYMLNPVAASPNPDQWRKDYLDKMHSRLSLSGDQMTKLGGILDATRVRGKALKAKSEKEAFDRSRPEMKVIQDEQVQKINEMLSETQRVEYEKFRAEMRAEREKRRQQQKNTNAKPALPPGD